MGKSQFVCGLLFFLIESYVVCQVPTPYMKSMTPSNDVCLVNYAGTLVVRSVIDFSGTGSFWSRQVRFKVSSTVICSFNVTVCPSLSTTGICYCENKVGDLYSVVMNHTFTSLLAGSYVMVELRAKDGVTTRTSSSMSYPRLSDDVTQRLVIDGVTVTTNASCIKAGSLNYTVMGLDSPYTVTCNTTSTSSQVTFVSSVGSVVLNLDDSTSQVCCGYVEDGPTCNRSAWTCYCLGVLLPEPPPVLPCGPDCRFRQASNFNPPTVPPYRPDCKFWEGSTFTLFFLMIVQMALGATYLVFCACKDKPGCFSSHWYNVLMGASCGMVSLTLVGMAVLGSQEMNDDCLSICQYLFVLFFLLPTVTVTVYAMVLWAKGFLDIIFVSPFVLQAIAIYIFICVVFVFAEKGNDGSRKDWHIVFLFFGCVIIFAVIVGIIAHLHAAEVKSRKHQSKPHRLDHQESPSKTRDRSNAEA